MDEIDQKLKMLAKLEIERGFSPGFSERIMDKLPAWEHKSGDNNWDWTSLFWVFKRVSFAGAALTLILLALVLFPNKNMNEINSGDVESNYSLSEIADGVTNQIYEVVF